MENPIKMDDFGNIYLSTIQNPPKHPKKKQNLQQIYPIHSITAP